MGDFLTDLVAKRRKFIEGLDANIGDINLDIFEDFYPDQAHFVFELLQNAEDAEATDATFTLTAEGCWFEHDGKRLFSEDDVRSITGIHNSTKSKSVDKIGKFGVGFKSVFVYTSRPEVYSGEFAFRITGLVMPEPVAGEHTRPGLTRFWLPFNNPKKGPEDAYAEVQAGLRDLAESTLIFLSNLNCISWKIDDGQQGSIIRHHHSEHHIEVFKEADGRTTASSHFLKFEQAAEGLEKQRAAIAYALDFLPGLSVFTGNKALSEQLRIVETEGKVAVYFPAEKEISGLRFHLHAPLVPELSRASIKETPANAPLFKQLAKLAAASLFPIRDLGLLTSDFLAVLPNPQDQIPSRYKDIETSIIAMMRNKPLTPTYAKSHAAAKRLRQAKAAMKEVLSDEDIEFLITYDGEPPLWAIAATQRNSNVDRFLDALEIEEWRVDELVECLNGNLSQGCYYHDEEDETAYVRWLSGKAVEWHQSFYAMLFRELEPEGELYQLRDVKLVLLEDGSYATGLKCYFPAADGSQQDGLPRANAAVFTSGKSKRQQQDARRFLEEIGVREVGEREQVEVILAQRYTREAEIPAYSTYIRDLRRFIALVEKEPDAASLFSNSYIFERAIDDWACPEDVFLDLPIVETGLRHFYEALGEEAAVFRLADRYSNCGISAKKLAAFSKAVGAITELKPESTTCYQNPAWSYLASVGGERHTSPINRDYHISGLEDLFGVPSVELSSLVWRTMCALPADGRYFRAVYRRNASSGSHQAPSQLVYQLRNAAWVPQGEGEFVRPAEASSSLLPPGFAIDPGWGWLKAIEFGTEQRKKSEQSQRRQELAREIGFEDEDSLERARRFAALKPEVQAQVLDELERKTLFELPEREPSNPERRAERVGGLAANAPERLTEQRTRSVSVGREAVKEETAEYLRQQYESGGEMTCQICKGPMPFRLDDGRPYFEKVEFLPELGRRHFQNYLALCPNHAAMYAHTNGSAEFLKDGFLEVECNEIEVIIAQRDETIYFTRTHIADLKAVIESDEAEESGKAERAAE
ncbi:sacsin N-terminal ATP-binding-like domain-containing protein [Rhizobium leguminosarum]|uniref:sacsin N-terminal ATP-binding-like domain-containing protein n=1 Tax=Rhizobium leguminosarum TaxID=384 RepID=UPI002FF1E831